MWNFDSVDIKALANETTRLTTAGIESFLSKKGDYCRSSAEPNYDSLVDTVTDKVVGNLKDLSLCHSAELQSPPNVNYVTNWVSRNPRKLNNNRYFGQGGIYCGKPQKQAHSRGNSHLRCRCCQSTDQLIKN